MSREADGYKVVCQHALDIDTCQEPACRAVAAKSRKLMSGADEAFPAATAFVTQFVREDRVRGLVQFLRRNAGDIAGDLVAILVEREDMRLEVESYRAALEKIAELEEGGSPSPAGRMGDVARAALRGANRK